MRVNREIRVIGQSNQWEQIYFLCRRAHEAIAPRGPNMHAGQRNERRLF